MSSELTSGDKVERIDTPDGKFETDVPGVFADDQLHSGSVKFPVFDVEKEDFYNNMTADRKRMRFKSGTAAQGYMSNTRYRNPFFVRYTDDSGRKYQRRVK